MSQTTIEEIALAVKRAKDLARETMRVQYVYFDGLLLHISHEYERGRAIAAKCFPGGRTELKGSFGDQVREWQEANGKLKPCPSCGKAQMTDEERGDTVPYSGRERICDSRQCGCVMRDWNTRPLEAAMQVEVDRLNKLLYAAKSGLMSYHTETAVQNWHKRYWIS